MPYALVPKDYTLKKVTPQQRAAVDAQRSHENVMALIDNPEIIKQIIITGFAYLAVRVGKEALQDLKDFGVNISKDVEDAYTKKRSVGAPVGVSIEQVVDEALKRLTNLI